MDSQPLVLFENEDIEVLRYQRDYPQIIRLKSSIPQGSPSSTSSHANSYDQVYNDIICHFRQNGEADSFLHQVISSKEKVCRLLMNP
jgi:hypothetical protein